MGQDWDHVEHMERLRDLLVLEHTIRARSNLLPTAIMVPLGVHRGLEQIAGHDAIAGDRWALIYEPSRGM